MAQFQRFAAAALALSATAGGFGYWRGIPAAVLVVFVIWLPGHVLVTTAFAPRSRNAWSSGPAAPVAAWVAGMFVFGLALAPVALAGWGWTATVRTTAFLQLGIACAALASMRVGTRALTGCSGPSAKATRTQSRDTYVVAGMVLAVLLPMVLTYAGGKVDDWWDLAFIRAHAEASSFSFLQPVITGDLVHPRFSWNLWWLLQSFLSTYSGRDPVEMQSALVPFLVCVLSVSALTSLAASLFLPDTEPAVAPGSTRSLSPSRETQVALLLMPVWLYGTEAFPYFTRLHQDKFAAVLVAAPLTIAVLLQALRTPSRLHSVAVFVAAAVTCSIHSVVYGYLLLLGAAVVVACTGVHDLRRHALTSVALALPVVFPLWQSYALSELFVAQGISLANMGNPVVRAHVWLDRLAGAGSPYYIVRPSAAFGPVALVALPGLAVAWRRRAQVGMRALIALAVVPCLLAFIPGVAAIVGRVFVPWMLYRVLWFVPVAVGGALTVSWVTDNSEGLRRAASLVLLGAVTLALAVPVAADRAHRGMSVRPFERSAHPEAAALAAYSFLRNEPGRGAVLAPAGFSELVPAMTGRPVVAISERGTLVFSPTERGAYERLRDRAEFFARDSTPAHRTDIADRYGVTHAVFRKKYIATGSEAALLRRYSAEGVLLRTAAEQAGAGEVWSTSTARIRAGLSAGWSVVFDSADFVVARRQVTGDDAVSERPLQDVEAAAVREEPPSRWLRVFELTEPAATIAGENSEPPAAHRLLASLVGEPGADIRIDPVPLAIGNAETLVWTSGVALWDDGPSEVSVTLGFGTVCEPTRVEVLPYLRKSRREVWEIRASIRRASEARFLPARPIPIIARALDHRPIVVELGAAADGPGSTAHASRASTAGTIGAAAEVRIEVRSMLGEPFGIADIRVFGDRSLCAGQRPGPATGPLQEIDLSELLSMAASYPNDARPAIAVHRRLNEMGAFADADAFLQAALLRDPSLANGLVELGLARDRDGRMEEAGELFRRAVRADSNNAWARGCLAWSDQRRGRPLRALWQAGRAADLDERYADAWTIKGIAQRSLGMRGAALSSLRRAVRLDPRRDWGTYELSATLARAGRREDARRVLSRYLQLSPGRPETLTRLAALDAEEGGTK